MRRYFKILYFSLGCALLLSVFFLPAGRPVYSAQDRGRAEAVIPVRAEGAVCHAALFDADGRQIGDAVLVTPGMEGKLTVVCESLAVLHYTVRLTDSDTDAVAYDRTVFPVDVVPYYDTGEQLRCVVVADPYGTIAEGKLEYLNFKNTVKTSEPPTEPPTLPPTSTEVPASSEAPSSSENPSTENPSTESPSSVYPSTEVPSTEDSSTDSSGTTSAPRTTKGTDTTTKAPSRTATPTKTGDGSHLAVWVTLFVLCVVVTAVLFVRRRHIG